MEKNSGVHVLYKNLGETPYEAILRFKKENPEYVDEPMTYAGRLDPMAEGLLLVLSGEELSKKDEYLNLPKTYEFEILWGFETDTLDILGVVNQDSQSVPGEDALNGYIEKSIGRFEQVYPVFSSKPVNGKPLFQWAREGKLSEIVVPSHKVEIYKTNFNSRKTISGLELMNRIENDIKLVNGDFRQSEILQKWREKFMGHKESIFIIDSIMVTVSGGFYVRQFVSDIAKKLNSSAVTFSIKRTSVGKYSFANKFD